MPAFTFHVCAYYSSVQFLFIFWQIMVDLWWMFRESKSIESRAFNNTEQTAILLNNQNHYDDGLRISHVFRL